MIESPVKTAPQGRRAEVQALVCTVPCGPSRALVALKLIAEAGGPAGEYFLPLALPDEDATNRSVTYLGLTAAIDKLRSLQIDRVLIVVDDDLLVDELERRAEPPKELYLQYVIAGCKLNEFRRARVVLSHATRLEQLRTRAQSLATTVYSATPLLAHAI
jgi:ribonuclease HI